MSNKEILTKAVEKAIAGGWTFFDWLEDNTRYEVGGWSDGVIDVMFYKDHGGAIGEIMEWLGESPTIIFNHDFAKSLWGSNYKHTCGRHYHLRDCQDHLLPLWKWHLQQMVIADDPIEYLGENI